MVSLLSAWQEKQAQESDAGSENFVSTSIVLEGTKLPTVPLQPLISAHNNRIPMSTLNP